MSNPLQVKASNPHVGAWVSASAGTGKTKILTDRAIRLLLGQVDPSKILCITFTNAAANEMHERIMHKLEQIAASDDRQISEILADMIGQLPNKDMIAGAKSLYAKYLRSEHKISINTLHSYCQKILKKFPLEAGITPNFLIMDEGSQQEAISSIRKQILLSQELTHINKFFAENFHQKTIDDLFANILQHRTKFANNLEESNDTDNILSDIVCNLIKQIESKSSAEFQAIAAYPLVQNLVGFNINAEDIKSFFLTKTGEPKKRIVPAKIAKPGSTMHDQLLQIQQNVYELDQLERSKEVENFSKIIAIFAAKFLSMYESYKKAKSYLDYDDLIIKTRSLLLDDDARSWVLYKLDGGIEHILVDEAQDTSRDQWLIIEALIQEFFAEATDEPDSRSIFVVGDEKQSIFSFQGADVHSFLKMNKKFTSKISAAKNNFVNIELDISYRSCGEILSVVHQLFDNLPKDILNTYPRGQRFKIPKIKAHRSNHPGKVELWDLQRAEDEEKNFWQFDTSSGVNNSSSISRLAKSIAEYIDQQINSGAILSVSGKPVSAGDFMILFRTRSQLTKEVISELQLRSIPTSGLDRIKLADELLIKDIMSLARFVLNPEDSLNTAAMLKAPFITASLAEQFNFDKLSEILFSIYRNNSAVDFFETIIELFNIRNFALTSYTHDCLDLLNEFIKCLTRYASNKDGSLHGFISWFDSQESEIKRESNALNQVQIMTVHGSKGLQAPIVILCDTTSTPTQSAGLYWSDSGQVQTALNAGYVSEQFQYMKEQAKNIEFHEYIRLLYVAMTRAEDHLIICGYSNKKSLPANCWYELAKHAILALDAKREEDKYIYQQSAMQYVMDSKVKPAINNDNIIEFTQEYCDLQEYSISNNNSDIQDDNKIAVSGNIVSPIQTAGSIEYGIVFHKILEDLVKTKNLDKMHLHPLIKTLEPAQQNRLLISIELLQQNSQFLDLLDGDIKTELSIGAHNQDTDIGRIDLLVLKENIINIVDYKTDKRVPSDINEIPDNYVKQLESYETAMKTIFPEHKCRKYILWLENATLQKL